VLGGRGNAGLELKKDAEFQKDTQIMALDEHESSGEKKNVGNSRGTKVARKKQLVGEKAKNQTVRGEKRWIRRKGKNSRSGKLTWENLLTRKNRDQNGNTKSMRAT